MAGSASLPLIRRRLGRRDYQPVWEAMREFTDQRAVDQVDELWVVEHDPVFTQGLAGKPEHILNPQGIPIIQTDRGGQVTYHGPGQVVVYPLLDIDRRALGVRCLVDRLEQAVIDLLAELEIDSQRQEGAPGVFIDGAKIASIGLKVRRGRTYHGLAMNVDMDLSPFSCINPCGFAGLRMTQLADHRPGIDLDQASERLCTSICRVLGYHESEIGVVDAPSLASEDALP
ncbi:octanoyltransferase [Leptolyngbya valderiana BDU 20041]|nr:octanoyltransferase [Leptolyngbya valderiana BDU 20041]